MKSRPTRPSLQAVAVALILTAMTALGAHVGADDVPLGCDVVGIAGSVCGVWVHWSDLPEARAGHVVGHDEVLQHLYIHGGYDDAGTVRDTLYRYAYATQSWATLAPGPARADHVGGLDAAAGKLYVFGGTDGTTTYDDVWVYDVSTDGWSLLGASGGPTARVDAAGIWDPTQEELQVFGGFSGGLPSGELWRLDPAAATWTLGPNAPAARGGAAAVWDDVRPGMLIHGGTQGAGALADVWLYEPFVDRWTELAASSEARTDHTGIWDPASVNLITIAGATPSGRDAATWVFSPHTGLWVEQVDAPPNVTDGAGAWTELESRAYIVGGDDGTGPTTAVWWFTPGVPTWAV